MSETEKTQEADESQSAESRAVDRDREAEEREEEQPEAEERDEEADDEGEGGEDEEDQEQRERRKEREREEAEREVETDTLAEIESIAGFEGRGPGTDAERRAADYLADRLGALGREVEVEPIQVHPKWATTHAIFALLMVITSVVSVSYPFWGALAALVIAALAVLDIGGTLHSLRRLLGRRASQNVVSKEEDEDKDGVIVLIAHYDANRTGAPFGRRLVERWAAASERIGSPIGPFQPYIFALILVMVCTLLRMFGIQNLIVSIVQFIPTVLLIIHIPAFVDVAMSPFVPGANNNASGVATVLRLAERYGGRLDHFNVWAIFAGAGDGRQLGMARWIRQNRGELDPEKTIFICIDKAGSGTVRWHTSEGYISMVPFHDTLISYCSEIAEADDEEEEPQFNARGIQRRTASEAHVVRSQQFPAITISSLNALNYSPNNHTPEDTVDRIDEQALERVYGFCCRLIEMVDERIGEEFEKAGEQTMLAEDE